MKYITYTFALCALLLQGNSVLGQATQGGGAYVDGATITNSVVSGNEAVGEGTGVYAAGSSALVNNTVADNAQSKANRTATQKVGDAFGGGIVFFVDEVAHKLLVVSPNEAPSSVEYSYKTWGEDGQDIATASDLNDGAANSAAILAAQVVTRAIDAEVDNPRATEHNGSSKFKLPADTARRAAHWCAESKTAEQTDWFLPSREQLKKLYVAKDIVNVALVAAGATTLGSGYYWSSTQANAYEAWYVFFDNGETNTGVKTNVANVRPIREYSY
jgi:hypothetical protein